MISVSDTVMQALLAAVLLLPLAGAVAALLPAPPGLRGRDPEQAVLRHGVTVTGAVLAVTVVLALGFDTDQPGAMQAESDVELDPVPGHPPPPRDRRGLAATARTDGPAHLPVRAPQLRRVTPARPVDRLSTGQPQPGSPQAFVALILLLETGTLATFATLDLILFFLAFETVLIPMYFLIARWGGEERGPAAWKFILYTLLGSVVMLLGLLLIGRQGRHVRHGGARRRRARRA